MHDGRPRLVVPAASGRWYQCWMQWRSNQYDVVPPRMQALNHELQHRTLTLKAGGRRSAQILWRACLCRGTCRIPGPIVCAKCRGRWQMTEPQHYVLNAEAGGSFGGSALALGNPHLLEGGQRRQDGATDPDTVLALGRRNHLDLH